eukprot:c8506_g1_i2.p1 GENE.c8506_g1_i2~~c8506_g1_i2.p1  ORF type:complete len:274 (-),score=63.42 c8506_g1_i2:17-838(-)
MHYRVTFTYFRTNSFRVSCVHTRTPFTHAIAIHNITHYQIFLDTPGIVDQHEPHRRYYEPLATRAWEAVDSADAVVLVVDSVKRFDHNLEHVLKKLGSYPCKKFLVLNKIDLITSPHIEAKAATTERTALAILPFDKIFRISALNHIGLDDVKTSLFGVATKGDWQFAPTTKTDLPLLRRCEEIIREKVFQQLHREIPYQVAQRNMGWTILPNGDLRIDQTLLVAREQHKTIIRHRLKSITFQAIPELEQLTQRHVHLFLNPKVDEHTVDYVD